MRFFTELPAHTCIVPVPTHRQQLRKRGFNPAGVLASALSKATGRPMQATTLECRKPRPSTKGLGQLARRARRTSDFTTRKGHRFHGPVLLVDDVMTTGATIRAVTRRCLKSGATEVWVAVLARTPRD